MEAPIQTTIFYFAVVDGKKYSAQTVISGDDTEHEKRLGDFFNTLVAQVDENGEDVFVKFEPRELGYSKSSAPAGPGKPLPDAVGLPNCPIHNVPVKQKNGRNGPFVSCSERTASGGYCNWKPATNH